MIQYDTRKITGQETTYPKSLLKRKVEANTIQTAE